MKKRAKTSGIAIERLRNVNRDGMSVSARITRKLQLKPELIQMSGRNSALSSATSSRINGFYDKNVGVLQAVKNE